MSINFRNPKPARLRWQKSSIQKFLLLQKTHSGRQAGRKRQAVIVFTDTKKVISK
jgi:hypothetical protein